MSYTAPATQDAVDGPGVASCVQALGSTFAVGTTEVTCSAVDAAGNFAVDSFFDITVTDTTAPVIETELVALTLEATSPLGAVVPYPLPTATDLGLSLLVVCEPPPGGTFAIGDTAVTCTATDESGNTATTSATMTVEDTTAPIMTELVALTLEATSPLGAVVPYSLPTATDLGESLLVVCEPPSGGTFPIGDTVVACTATDGSGNTTTSSATMTVEDTTGPTLTLPADITAEATSGSGAVATFTVTAVDDVDPGPVVSCVPPSGTEFESGDTTVTCTGTDADGNATSGTFVVTVEDTAAPVFETELVALTLQATSPLGAVVEYLLPTATDLSGPVPVVCEPPSGGTFAVGDTEVTCTATDGSGNATTTSATMTVLPIPLIITAEPVTKTYDGTPVSGFTVSYDGFLGGENESILDGGLAFGGDSQAAVDVGTYAVVPSGLTSSVYGITYVDGTSEITPAPLTAVANDQTKVYGEANPTLDGTVTGAVAADNITASYDTTATTTSGVGSHPITVTLADPDNRLGNYTVTTTDAR